MSAESPRHMRCGGPLTVPAQPPADRSIIDAVSGFINDVKLTSPTVDAKDVIQWARFETADINEPTSEGDSDTDISPLLLILGYGTGVQVWLIPPNGEAQEVLSWRQGTVRVLRILPTPDRGDCFTAKRPLIALCDSASPGLAFCSLSFISIRGGEQVKSIKFKNPILDVLANKRSVVVSFSERFAVFDAGTLEDRLSVTTCYPCPCPLGGATSVNPLALGDRWLAYADKKLNPSKRSSGGCESEGQTSYTATVLHAAKSLSKGLRGLGESVAQSLSGTRGTSQSPSPPHSDLMQPGVVTVLDIEGIEEEDGQDAEDPCEPTVAHFIAHSEPVTALKFDASGLILVTADRRGHDFHVFRLNPHPCGPSLASAHHLYVLHRGDTTAKVQDISISIDCRWVAVSTLRGTTHIFGVAPYGGAPGVRTHTQPRVVNRLSRFHRSAGLPIHSPAKPASPVGDAGQWFPNPRLPPYPAPVQCAPLAQLRPTANLATHTITRTSSGRQRLSSLSEESPNSGPLLARAAWGRAGAARAGGALALYLMTASGNLLHLLLHPRPANSIPKEKISDESPIEVEVEAVAQWPLQRPPAASDLLAPLPPNNPLLHVPPCRRCTDMCMSEEERWLAQVEIVTHAGPHRRLWMGPQFVFKTYNCTGSNSSLSEAEAVEVESVARSNPVNMPAAVPILVDSGSASSLEQSPSDSFRRKSLLSEPRAASVCDVRLKEDLAEAMKEDHGSRREEAGPMTQHNTMELAVDPLGTVVRTHTADPVPRLDPDDYTRANTDEATFRPVLNAPATLPPASLPAKPLPLTTTIPVQSLTDDFTIYSTNLNDYDHVEKPIVVQSQEPIPAKRKGKDDKPRDATPEKKQMTKDLDLKVGQTKKVEPETASKEKRESEPAVKKIPEETAPKVEIEEVKVVKDKKSDSKPAKSKSESKSAKKEPELKTDITESNKDVSANKVVTDTKKENTEIKKVTQKEETPIDKKEVSETKKEFMVGKKDTTDSKKSSSVRKEVVEPKNSESENEPVAPKKEQVEVRKEIPELKTITKKETSQKDISKTEVEIKTSTEKEPEMKTSKKAERKKSAEKELSNIKQSERKEDEKLSTKKDEKLSTKKDGKLSTKKDEILSTKKETTTKSVKEPTPEPRLITKTDSERDSSPKKDLTELKSSWKRDTKLEWSTKSETNEKSLQKEPEVTKIQIKTEEQAWDMLLNEPEKPVLNVSPQSSVSDESKKSKKNRKIKKSEETQKSEDDSFVEIHAIEDKIQSSGELVSISVPFEEIESTSSKTKKSSSKSLEKKEQTKLDDWSLDMECAIQTTKRKSIPSDVEVVLEYDTKIKHKESKDCFRVETEVMDTKDYNRTKASNQESRKSAELDVKDVYVIDSTKEEFPEIQITSGRKNRKKSPQVEKSEEIEVIPEKPIKSWSSIAASKNKKEEPKAKADRNIEKELDYKDASDFKVIKPERSDKNDVKKVDSDLKVGRTENKQTVSKYEDDEPPLSLHEELMRLCKRTDIMVAECDAPSELNFVDEHLLHDLPPLDLDFGMDDFNLEVMRDSLLEHDTKISSPICKIDIDSILSSIKESTSAFNLIDLEKVPDKKEKGFSVVENDKITSSEVKADDEPSAKSEEAMEKSSDDDNASPASADSDKEDKKSTGASNITLPSTKQSKAKKSRRKKK